MVTQTEKPDQAEIQTERESLVAEREAILEAERAQIPVRAGKIEEARAAVEIARAELLEVEQAYHAARNEDHLARSVANRQLTQLESRLRDTAPECIDTLIQEMWRLLESARSTFRPMMTVDHVAPLTSRSREVRVVDRDVMTARHEAIRAVITSAESLKLAADPDICARLGELRAELGLS